MSTLTDRYVWGVVRSVPAARRPDLEPEIRALVADAIEAREAAGADPATAEPAALAELGDPDLLAARYTDRSMVLIGPRYFAEWKRLLGLVLPIVVPVAILAVTAASFLAGTSAPELVGVAVSTGLQVAVHLVFWVTVAFALMERSGEMPAGVAWTPERLPELPKQRGESPIELAVAAVAIVVGSVLLVWQQAARPVVIEGVGYPILDPATFATWMPWFIGLLGVELVAILWRWRRGGWTWGLAVLNLGTNLAFAIPGLMLLSSGNLFDPGLEAAVERLGVTSALAPAGAVVMVVVAASAAWDAFDGFRKAWLRRADGAA